MIDEMSLLERLLIKYYKQPSDILTEAGLVSSHWQHYSAMFDVCLDRTGQPVSLQGIGFGNYQWNSITQRILDKMCILSYLPQLPMRWLREGLEFRKVICRVLKRMEIDLTYDAFRQACIIALIRSEMSEEMRNKRLRVLMIGDGYGVLAALIKEILPQAQLIMVDIGRTLFFQAFYCQKAHPNRTHRYWEDKSEEQTDDFIYCPAEFLHSLEYMRFDLAVNVNSMQEMNSFTINMYFAFLRKCLHADNFFYCCNREYNHLCGGEIVEFHRYPWVPGDHFILDSYCPWQKYFLAANWPEEGLNIGPIKLPIINFFLGKSRHRLVVLETC